VSLYKSVGDTVMQGEPIFEVHAESDSQLQATLEYSNSVQCLVRYDEGI
jgi:thymidine phosphorylase